MATQYSDVDKTYCSTCQTLSQYNEDVQVTTCSSAYEYINVDLYNEMVARLQKLNTFGDKDTKSPREPVGALDLIKKVNNTIIDTSFYNDIAKIVELNLMSKGDIVYGTYFDNLKEIINNYKIPSTRYYVCKSQSSYDCCSCYGQDCGQGCGQGCGECGECGQCGQSCCTSECGSYGNCGESSWAENRCSSRNVKENINVFELNAIDLISDIQIVDFNYINDPKKDYRVGFIADDTNAIFATKDHNQMDYYNCIGVLLKAIQELQQEIEDLKGN